MKQILIALTLIIAASGCKKTSTNPVSTSGISFTFNGTAKSTSVAAADYYKSQQSLQIIGNIGTSGEGINLFISNPAVGTFDVVKDGLLLSYVVAGSFADTYTATAGTVAITSFTTNSVAGTFQFNGTTPANVTGVVTNGKFQLSLITQ